MLPAPVRDGATARGGTEGACSTMSGRSSGADATHAPAGGPTAILALGLVLVVGAAIGLAALLRHDYTSRLEAGYRELDAQVLGMQRALVREFGNVERILQGIGTDSAQYASLAPARAQALLAGRVQGVGARHPQLRNLAVVDAAAVPAWLRDPALAGRDGTGVRIAPPRRAPDGEWVLPLALPVRAADGGERWVLGEYRVMHLSWLSDGLDLGSAGVGNLIHADGTMVLRSVDPLRHVGRDVAHTPLMRRVARDGNGYFDEPSPIDGGQRLIAYRALDKVPLVVALGRARVDATGDWRRFAGIVAGLAALLGALWLLALWVAVRSRARQAALTASLAETRRIAGIGDWTWWPDRRETLLSPEVWRMFGLAPRDAPMSDQELLEHVHPDDRERLSGVTTASAAGGVGGDLQYRIVRPDGEVRTVYSRGEWQQGRGGARVMRGTQQDVTELATARARLRAAERQYHALFDENPLPAYVFDRDTLRFLAVNDAMVRTYGYSRDELLAMTIFAIRPDSEHPGLRALLDADDIEAVQGRVMTHRRRDGTRLRVSVHVRNIEFEGRPARLTLAQDVTEAERLSERMALVARGTSDAIYDYDIAAGLLWWSETLQSVFGDVEGLDMRTLAGWSGRGNPADAARVPASMDAALASDASEWESSYRFLRADGSHADVIDKALVVRDADGTAVRMVGGMLDISERMRSRNDLRLLQRAIEAADNGILIADARVPNLPIVYANPAFEAMTGYSIAEVTGTNCRMLQRDDRDQAGIASIRNAIADGRETRVLLRNYRKDGTLFWNDFYLAPVRDDDGTLTHFVGIQNDVTERQHYEEQLAYRATHDELTGLPNRQLLLDRLEQGLLNAERYGRGVGVVFIDLDDFKLVNDSLGHTAGDAALVAVAQRLRQAVRDTDTVGRFGGDEFVIVLTEQTEAEEAGIRHVVDRITAALAAPVSIAGVEHVLTPSIGYGRYPDAGRTAEQLLMHADVAMYEAKRQGRNRAVAYRTEFEDAASQRLRQVARLREALERREFGLAFQPVFDVAGAVVGVEALARWHHPERGVLPPAEFIATCEDSGLILDLGRQVLEMAAVHHGRLREAGFGHLRVAINVSAAQFTTDFDADVAAAIEAHALPPSALEVEITESVVMDNPEAAIAAMQRLARRGVCIALDDFGTGYSSLAYLKRLPIHRLKIDRSFVRDLPADADDAAICKLVIGIAHTLQLTTVAEGVETAAQADWLRAHGCDELQGHHLAMPMPFDELLAMLRSATAMA